ncbi:LVIVD repeat protein [Aureliella helgolandensis]|uniref:LVIVD repeat protein n=2 Tax=Aureliella helgolandensis TaxID=2527968 RepID=A0A518G1R6_9BACT|nr:LVIVD repeat protein [Aureliella helgolandensis]
MVASLPLRSTLISFLAVAMIALLPDSLSALGPSEIVGAWVMSVDSRLSPESVDLEIDHQPDVWKVTLRSGAGAVTTDRVNLEEDVLSIRYGVKPLDVRVELRVLGKSMSGSVVTGEGDTLRRQSITAHRVPEFDATPAPKQVVESNKTVEQAREFFGAWELSLQRANAEPTKAIRLGMVVTESDEDLIVGHSEFEMKGPQKRVDQVQSTHEGLRWILDGGMFGLLNVDLVSESEKLRVKVSGSDQEAFLVGTAIRKPKASDVGVDWEQLVQKPGTELVGVIGGDARVVEVDSDRIIIQQREVVSRMFKDDPLLVLFEWFRLPEGSRLIAVETDTAWSVTGATIDSWDIRNSQTPLALGSCKLPGNPPELVHRSGQLVFAANWNGHADTQQLHVIDVSDPSSPMLLASHSTPKGLSNYDLAVSGSTIYLANAGGLRIADATNPQTLVMRSNFVGRGRWVRGVDVVGSTAYIATSMHGGASWLQIIDASDPMTAVQTGLYRSTGGAQDVSVCGDLAVLADRAAGIIVLDVSEPQNVRRVGYFRTKGRSNEVDIFGELAFVAMDGDAGSRTLQVIRFME